MTENRLQIECLATYILYSVLLLMLEWIIKNAASIVCAMGYAGAGLTVTTAFIFAADRSSRLYCETTGNLDLESVLRTVFNPDGTLTT